LETFVLEAFNYCVCIKWLIGFSIKGDNLYKEKCEAIAFVCVCVFVFVCVCLCQHCRPDYMCVMNAR